MYDQDGSGFIDIAELEEIMGKIGRNQDQGAMLI
jgi:Ca2+-binding EF-hand superfamily protein